MRQFVLQFPVLIGDIGGTNARFSIISKKGNEEQIFSTKTVSDYSNIDAAIEQSVLPIAKVKPRSLMLAIAGPVEGEEITLTNSHWVIRPNELIEKFSFENVFVINDFEAQALATVTLQNDYLQCVGEVNNKIAGSRVILGPGTGLGVAGLTHANGRYLPIAGEGGHIDYSPRSERDLQLFSLLDRIEGRVSAEQLLSGRGLMNIYRAICQADGVAPAFNSPNAITIAAHSKINQQASETVDFFLTYLARLSGDFALIFKANGGVYIGGGITPKIFKLIDQKAFREAFEDKAPHRNLLKNIPIFVMTHPRAALEGMATFAKYPLKFTMDIGNRVWPHDLEKDFDE